MNHTHFPHWLLIAVVFFFGLKQEDIQAQETEAAQALTVEHYPYRFSERNPLTAKSPILLEFSQPVSPETAAGFVSLYDKPNERVARVTTERPDAKTIKALMGNRETDLPVEHYVVILPASPLPINGTWYVYTKAGLTSIDGSTQIVESGLSYIGSLKEFRIDEIASRNNYNEQPEIVVTTNKAHLHSSFDAAALQEQISISPQPENLSIDIRPYRLRLMADFDYGVEYQVHIKEGIIANDHTQLAQSVKEDISFVPNPGFITYPAFTTTQNATGHRRFDIKTGNLTGLRTRVKHLEGDDVILAMREYSDNYEGWGEEQTLPFASVPGRQIYDQFRDTTIDIDHSETVSLQWDELIGEGSKGAFYLCSEGQSSTRDQLAVGAQSLIQLTDIGLAWKQADDSTLLYAFSLQSGTPLPGVKVRLVNDDAQPLTEAVTDDSGIAHIDANSYAGIESRLYIDTSLGADRHVISFYQDLSSMGLWRFDVDQRWDEVSDGERRTLIFTDRNVYKPGDEVKIKSISRFLNADQLLGAGSGKAVLRLFDPRHRKILERDITFDDSGAFDDSFTLPTSGLGWHSLEIDFNEDPDEEYTDWRLISHHSFQVEEYRANTFEVSIDSKASYQTGEAIEVPLRAKYYMGKALSKAEAQWNLYSYSDYPRPRGFEQFSFGDLTTDDSYYSDEGTLALSSQGEASIQFALPDQSSNPAPRFVQVTAQVTDANQQTISTSKSFTVHSSDFYLGLREPEGVHRAGDTALFSLAAVTSEGKAHTAPVVGRLLVEKEIWTTVKVMGANGRMTHRNDKRMQTVSEETITIETQVDPESGLVQAMPHSITFEEAGDFIVTITARDEKNRPMITRTEFTVIGAEEPSWSWHDVIRIDLIPDKEAYSIGDTAKLLVRTPVFGSALFTTERGGVRSSRTLQINQYETILEVPIESGDAPNIFASLLIIRGSDQSPHIHTFSDYRLGYCQLEVDDPESHLDITLNSGEVEFYQPGEEVTVSALIADAAGQPVSGADVTFFAVDEGVLSLTAHKTPDPHEVFHATFPLSVFTGQSISSLLPENPLEQDFINKGYVIGGGGAPGLDPDRVRKNFKALAFWEPKLTTGSDGEASVTFTAPDNLTTFRLMAVVAEGNRFGHAESPLVINKPFIIEPALPRFSNLTDQIDVTAVLHNNTDRPQEVDISVQLDDHAVFVTAIGETLKTNLEDPTRTLKTEKAFLNPGATETLSFPIALTATGEAKWIWSAQSATEDNLQDATESTLTIGYPLPLLRESHTFRIEDGRSLENALSEVAPRLLEGEGELELTLSNSRLAGAADALEYLLTYPYGCVEQTSSSLVPWLTTTELRPVMPQLEKSEAEVATVIQKGIDRLFSMQTGNGGLGYWPGSSESVLWGSAYAGVAIALAQQQGIAVPEARATSLWDYLSESLREVSEITDAYQLSQRCLASYALALAGRNETAYHGVLFEKKKELSSEARALLALAIVESGADTPDRIDELLANDAGVPVAEVTWYKKPYLAATRLLAEVRHNPSSDRVDEFVNDLMDLRQPQRGWGSTYSNAWPLIALAEYSRSEASTISANEVTVSFNNEQQQVALPGSPGSISTTFDYQGLSSDQGMSLSPTGASPVYATLRVAARPELAPMEPENNGFAIQRTYEKVEVDGTIVPADNLQVGDLILVTLDVNLPTGKETYLAIDDPLPSIFEAVNPRFKTQATQDVNQENSKRSLYANYQEIQEDRVLYFADYLSREGDYRTQYLARIVAAGQVTAPPAKIEAMYEPQRFGLSGTEQISASARPLSSDPIAAR